MSDSIGSSVDAVIAAGGSKVTHAGAATIAAGWLLSSEAAVLIGILMSIGGFLTNLYFKRREDGRLRQVATDQARQVAERARQDAEYHAARMAALRSGRALDES